MENLFALTLSVQDAEEEFSWQTMETSGSVENVESDAAKNTLEKTGDSRGDAHGKNTACFRNDDLLKRMRFAGNSILHR